MKTSLKAVLISAVSVLAATIGVAAAVGVASALEVSGTIVSSLRWTATGSPYVVTGDVTVAEGVVLTIDPGVVVKFRPSRSLVVDGALQARGTAGSQIVFTSYSDDTAGGDTNGDQGASAPGPDQWGGIVFTSSSNDALCVMDYCQVRYGGYWATASGDRNVLIENASPTLSNCRFGDTGGPSVFVSADSSSPKIVNSSFANPGDWPIRVSAMGLSNIGPNTYSGSGHDGVFVYSSDVWGQTTWKETGASLFLESDVSVSRGATLTISPGVVVKTERGGLVVEGAIVARGTAASRVYFTSYRDDSVGGDTNADGAASVPGIDQWGGIKFEPTSDDGRCILDYVTVRYGGYWATPAGDNGIRIVGSSPTISNTRVTDTGGDGIYCEVGGDPEEAASPRITACEFLNNAAIGVNADEGSSPRVTRNTFRGNNWPIGIYPAFSDTSLIRTDNIIAGNVHNGVRVFEGTIASTVTWKTVGGAPYVTREDVTISNKGVLNVTSGVVVKFGGRSSLVVDGVLSARGTATSAAVFASYTDDSVGGDTNGTEEGEAAGPDQWGGIKFSPSSDDNRCVMDYCEVRYGGYWATTAGDRNVYIENASPTLSNCRFGDAGGASIYVSPDSSSPRIVNCTFANPGNWPLSVSVMGLSNIGPNTYAGSGYDGVYMYSSDVSGRTTWKETGASLFLEGDVTVLHGGVLTIAPGVVVKTERGGLIVQGALVARGTSTSRVYFTSYRDDSVGGDTNADSDKSAPGPDQWGGIRFDPTSDDATCALDFVTVRYGGYWATPVGDAGIRIVGSSPTITNTVISSTSGDGIYCEAVEDPPESASPLIRMCELSDNTDTGVNADEGSFPRIRGTTFRRNHFPIGLYPLSADTAYIATDNAIADNTHNGVRVYGGTVASALTWRPIGVPYVLRDDDLTISASGILKITDGVVVKLGGRGNIVVNGVLSAKGAAASPVVFTSYRDDSAGGDTNGTEDGETAGPDQWGGIVFGPTSDDSRCVLDFCEVRYGGYWATAAGDRNILVEDASPTISNCQFGDAGGPNIYVSPDVSSPRVVNCVFTNPGNWPVHSSVMGLSNVGPNTYAGSGHDGVYVYPSDVSAQTAWKETGAPLYLETDVTVLQAGVLNIGPGVVVKTGSGGFVVDGAIAARGTAASRIYFTSYHDDTVGGDTNANGSESTPRADQWGGILFNPTSDDARCVLDFAVVRYGGYWATPVGDAGIRVVGAAPTISNSVVSNTGGDGIYCESGANPTINSSLLMGNTDHGVRNVDGSIRIRATGNWWGDSTGPYHKTLNAGGKGNAVSDNVLFDPWLRTEPATDTVPPVITSGPTVRNITKSGAVIEWTTGEWGSSGVHYGTTTAYGSSATGVAGTSHRVELAALASLTTYHFRASSADSSGNVVQSSDLAFTTLGRFSRLVISLTQSSGGAVIVNKQISIKAGLSQSLAADGIEADGKKVRVSPVWTVVGNVGDITSSGQFTPAKKAGSQGTIVARAEGVADSLFVTIAAAAPARLVITPSDVRVTPGQRLSFKAEAFDAYGNPIAKALTLWYTVGGIGTISKYNGAFTAAATPAAGYVIAYSQLTFGDTQAQVSGTAKVTVEHEVPTAYDLSQNYPNPFNPETTIGYSLPDAAYVRLRIFDMCGQEVRTLVYEIQPPGWYAQTWDGRDARGLPVATGEYLYRLEALRSIDGDLGFAQTRRMLLVR